VGIDQEGCSTTGLASGAVKQHRDGRSIHEFHRSAADDYSFHPRLGSISAPRVRVPFATRVNRRLPEGRPVHAVDRGRVVAPEQLASGLYTCRLQAGGFAASRKLFYIR
jgi:hypothetical protein